MTIVAGRCIASGPARSACSKGSGTAAASRARFRSACSDGVETAGGVVQGAPRIGTRGRALRTPIRRLRRGGTGRRFRLYVSRLGRLHDLNTIDVRRRPCAMLPVLVAADVEAALPARAASADSHDGAPAVGRRQPHWQDLPESTDDRRAASGAIHRHAAPRCRHGEPGSIRSGSTGINEFATIRQSERSGKYTPTRWRADRRRVRNDAALGGPIAGRQLTRAEFRRATTTPHRRRSGFFGAKIRAVSCTDSSDGRPRRAGRVTDAHARPGRVGGICRAHEGATGTTSLSANCGSCAATGRPAADIDATSPQFTRSSTRGRHEKTEGRARGSLRARGTAAAGRMAGTQRVQLSAAGAVRRIAATRLRSVTLHYRH